MLLPAAATGWLEWKTHYRGAKGLIFKRKIATAIGMAALSLPLVVWRIAALGFFEEAPDSPQHFDCILRIAAPDEHYFGGLRQCHVQCNQELRVVRRRGADLIGERL